MKKSCIAIRHLAFEDLGLLAPLLGQAGYEVTYREAGLQPPSDAQWLEADLVIVLGGPIGVHERHDYPWLADEIAGLRRRLEAVRPTLGICLGAQLMAAALGAQVYPGPAKEIGWGAVTLTDEAAASPLRHLASAPVLHWHGDTFDLPAGATLLASSDAYVCQAFAVGTTLLALQFHLEVDARRIEPWLIGHTAELRQAGMSVPALRAASAEVADASARAGRAVMAAWLGQLDGAACQAGRTASPAWVR